MRAVTKAEMTPHSELTMFSLMMIMDKTMIDASIKKDANDSLSFVYLSVQAWL